MRCLAQQYAYIQLIPQQYDYSVQPHPDHECYQRTYRSVNLIVVDKIVDDIKEYQGGNNTGYSGEHRPWRHKAEPVGQRRTVGVYDGNRAEYDHNHYQQAEHLYCIYTIENAKQQVIHSIGLNDEKPQRDDDNTDKHKS